MLFAVLVARSGKGTYVFTGLAFFRELPAVAHRCCVVQGLLIASAAMLKVEDDGSRTVRLFFREPPVVAHLACSWRHGGLWCVVVICGAWKSRRPV